ncbi:MAG: cytochrome c maturation protein CcmE [Deltaproteobacteria bacterium]|nr:cytochrome c maturation protein CcmE [Deltaproteobacteria bacterium]
MKKSHKFAIAGAVIFLTIVALIYTAFQQSSVYYMTVPELKSKGSSVVGQGLRASGQVKDGTINYDSEKLILNFDAFEKEMSSEIIHVTYKGIKPDSFKAGVEVILEGKYDPQENLFKAKTLLVKCPSRYEGKTPPPDYKQEKPTEGGKV